MDTTVLSKLVLAKNFCSRAKESSRRQDSLSRMVAIHHFHIAIEITLRNIVSHYEIDGYNQNSGFVELIGLIKNSEKFKTQNLKIPHEAKIKSVNLRRNDVQHNFLEPSDDFISLTAFDTTQFLRDSFQSLFSLDYEDVNESLLIRHNIVRQPVILAVKNHQVGNYKNACKCAEVAFKLGLYYISDDYQEESSRFDVSRTARKLYDDSGNFQKFARELEKMGDQVRKNAEVIKLMLSGVDMERYARYTRTRPIISFSMNGRVHPGLNRGNVIREDEALDAIEFVTSTILKLQNEMEPDVYSKFVEGMSAFNEYESNFLEEGGIY